MTNIKLITAILTAFVCSFPCADAVAQAAPPVTVTAWGMHRGGQVVYKYQVKNMGTKPIERFFIGYYPPTGTVDGAAELTAGPYYPGGTSLWLPPGVSQSPAGWGVYLSFPEESATFALAWAEAKYYRGMWPKANDADMPIAQNPPNVMLPGATWDQFSVTLPRPDYAYVLGHANFDYGDNDLTVQMVKGDTSLPTISVSLSPSTIWPANNKLVPITATISVKDNYDPEPEIKLESITPSEMSAPDDINDAALGTDDRQFMLRASRDGNNVAGRVYTVIYSATDASGNQSIATAAVTVPHDQRKHEEHHDEKDKKDKREQRQDR